MNKGSGCEKASTALDRASLGPLTFDYVISNKLRNVRLTCNLTTQADTELDLIGKS